MIGTPPEGGGRKASLGRRLLLLTILALVLIAALIWMSIWLFVPGSGDTLGDLGIFSFYINGIGGFPTHLLRVV
ncbi:MAG: hypothetical protein J0H18_04590 [Rhizobiales bacterium]|nr:hypothetical protein [Hyphomicrobiales bacterium]OJY07203.1 MAG: hypothetical protein BGP07_17475 [Rhizobiales bacterium 63-22]